MDPCGILYLKANSWDQLQSILNFTFCHYGMIWEKKPANTQNHSMIIFQQNSLNEHNQKALLKSHKGKGFIFKDWWTTLTNLSKAYKVDLSSLNPNFSEFKRAFVSKYANLLASWGLSNLSTTGIIEMGQ